MSRPIKKGVDVGRGGRGEAEGPGKLLDCAMKDDARVERALGPRGLSLARVARSSQASFFFKANPLAHCVYMPRARPQRSASDRYIPSLTHRLCLLSSPAMDPLLSCTLLPPS